MEHRHYKATIDEARYIVACANEPGKTMFWIHNGMGMTRIKLSDEAFLAMVNLFTRIQSDLVKTEVRVSRKDVKRRAQPTNSETRG